MQYPLLDFLCAPLIPELGADVTTGSSRHIHLILIRIAAVGTLPDQLTVFILNDLDLAVIITCLTVITLGI